MKLFFRVTRARIRQEHLELCRPLLLVNIFYLLYKLQFLGTPRHNQEDNRVKDFSNCFANATPTRPILGI